MICKAGSLWKVKMLALLCMVGKAKEAGKGCAELLWQENMSNLMVISPSFHKILDLGLQWQHQDLNAMSIIL